MTNSEGALKRDWRETDPGFYERKEDRSERDTEFWNQRPDDLIRAAVKNVRMPDAAVADSPATAPRR